jgi:hypothetical protein
VWALQLLLPKRLPMVIHPLPPFQLHTFAEVLENVQGVEAESLTFLEAAT